MTDHPETGIGATLRDAREAAGRSLEDVAAAVRTRPGQIAALEQEDFGAFGGDVYAKGFIRSYAVEVGIDAEPLLETYRREVGHDDAATGTLLRTGTSSSAGSRATPPAWIAWVLVAVVVVAGIGFVGSLGGGSGRSPEPADPDEGVATAPPSSAGQDDEAAEGDDTADDADADPDGEDAEDDDPTEGNDLDDEAEDEEAADAVDLVLALEEPSWMRVVVDGTLVLEETVAAGETLPFEGESEIEIRFGNAGGVIAELNGEDLGAPGGRGEAVTVRFTPDGVENV
jgi:cytoskeleton protein RodZ